MLTRITPPEPAVELDEAKTWLRVVSDDEDDLIEALIEAATAHFDGPHGILGRCLEPQTWEMVVDAFPASLVIPAGPVTAVSSIIYADGGADVTLDAEGYRLIGGTPFEAMVTHVGGWPDEGSNVRVRFTAGSGTPAPVRLAILATVAVWYDDREAGDIPEGAYIMAAPYRRMVV